MNSQESKYKSSETNNIIQKSKSKRKKKERSDGECNEEGNYKHNRNDSNNSSNNGSYESNGNNNSKNKQQSKIGKEKDGDFEISKRNNYTLSPKTKGSARTDKHEDEHILTPGSHENSSYSSSGHSEYENIGEKKRKQSRTNEKEKEKEKEKHKRIKKHNRSDNESITHNIIDTMNNGIRKNKQKIIKTTIYESPSIVNENKDIGYGNKKEPANGELRKENKKARTEDIVNYSKRTITENEIKKLKNMHKKKEKDKEKGKEKEKRGANKGKDRERINESLESTDESRNNYKDIRGKNRRNEKIDRGRSRDHKRDRGGNKEEEWSKNNNKEKGGNKYREKEKWKNRHKDRNKDRDISKSDTLSSISYTSKNEKHEAYQVEAETESDEETYSLESHESTYFKGEKTFHEKRREKRKRSRSRSKSSSRSRSRSTSIKREVENNRGESKKRENGKKKDGKHREHKRNGDYQYNRASSSSSSSSSNIHDVGREGNEYQMQQHTNKRKFSHFDKIYNLTKYGTFRDVDKWDTQNKRTYNKLHNYNNHTNYSSYNIYNNYGNRNNGYVKRTKFTSTKVIDRQRCCPFLLRLFYKLDEEYTEDDLVFDGGVESYKGNELQIYAWLDISMREIVTLVKDFYEESRKRNASWIFKVMPNKTKKLNFLSKIHSSKTNYKEDEKTLLSLNYDIGDIIFLSILFDK